MKHNTFFFGLAILLCGAAFFLGCPVEPADDGGHTFTVEVSPGETKYYSLSTGTEVSEGNSADWDIAFYKDPSSPVFLGPQIYTNSGVTAVNSGGKGGVWYTDKTDFDAVTLDDKKEAEGEYAGLDVDTKKHVHSQVHETLNQPGTQEAIMNVMTYLGYTRGNGSAEAPYEANSPFTGPANWTPYSYNKKQFYIIEAVSKQPYPLTNQVYIIKHGGAEEKYSKVQISAFEMLQVENKDVYQIKYENF
jgi:hypothetical protein